MAYNTTSWTTGDASATVGQAGPTLYADFFTCNTESSTWAAGYHHLLTFGNANFSSPVVVPNLGTSDDPATSFTLSDSPANKASTLVNCLWYVPDNITISNIYSIQGGDEDATDTTRMHLMSYVYNTGQASVLGGGNLLAHSDNIVNTGSTKSFFTEFTIDSPTVTAGKVIVATFESDSVNSDYTINIKVKYHLT